jgi:aconitate hydratase
MTFPNPFNTLQSFKNHRYYSLPNLEKRFRNIARFPVSIRIILESLLRNCDGKKVREQDIINLIQYHPSKPAHIDVPFCVAR